MRNRLKPKEVNDALTDVQGRVLPATTSASTGQILGLTGEGKTPSWVDNNALPSTTGATTGQILGLTGENKTPAWVNNPLPSTDSASTGDVLTLAGDNKTPTWVTPSGGGGFVNYTLYTQPKPEYGGNYLQYKLDDGQWEDYPAVSVDKVKIGCVELSWSSSYYILTSLYLCVFNGVIYYPGEIIKSIDYTGSLDEFTNTIYEYCPDITIPNETRKRKRTTK